MNATISLKEHKEVYSQEHYWDVYEIFTAFAKHGAKKFYLEHIAMAAIEMWDETIPIDEILYILDYFHQENGWFEIELEYKGESVTTEQLEKGEIELKECNPVIVFNPEYLKALEDREEEIDKNNIEKEKVE